MLKHQVDLARKEALRAVSSAEPMLSKVWLAEIVDLVLDVALPHLLDQENK